MIRNLSKKRTLVERTELADSVGRQTKGLMFREKLGEEEGFLMDFMRDGRHSIWMPFMRFPIDIIYIGRDKRVVDIKHSVPPMGRNPMTWRVYTPKEKARYVLETNAGLARKTETEIGDLLDF